LKRKKLVGNQTKGSRVALADIYEGWDWSATRGNQASPTITSLKKDKQHRHKKKKLRQPTRPEWVVGRTDLTTPGIPAIRLTIH
jgi:hypothetical protein